MSTWQRRFGIQLAYPYEQRKLEKWPKPWIVQPKLNGERCRVLFDSEGRATLLSSEENQIVSVPHIEQTLNALGLIETELDGELYVHGWPLQRIHGVVSRKRNISHEHEEIQLHLFDLIAPLSQIKRLESLYSLRSEVQDPLYIIESTPCTSVEEIQALLTAYMSEGYEGIIIRHPFAEYVRKRATHMLKWKPRQMDCYFIVGTFEAIDQYGVPKNTLGGLICEKDSIRFNVGAGMLTHSERDYWWLNRYKLPGRYAVIKYQDLTERGVPVPPVLCQVSEHYIPHE